MSDMNILAFTGRVVADAELKYAQSGKAMLRFRVACGYGFGDNKGTNFYSVTLFDKRAEGLAPYMVKGQQVAVKGEHQVVEYDRKDGTKGQDNRVERADVTLVGAKQESGNTSSTGSRGGAPQRERPAPATAEPAGDFDSSDDIPFATNRSRF